MYLMLNSFWNSILALSQRHLHFCLIYWYGKCLANILCLLLHLFQMNHLLCSFPVLLLCHLNYCYLLCFLSGLLRLNSHQHCLQQKFALNIVIISYYKLINLVKRRQKLCIQEIPKKFQFHIYIPKEVSQWLHFFAFSGRFFCKSSARLLLEGITYFIMGC